MKVNSLISDSEVELNTQIMRKVEEVVCEYRELLPNGWRVMIEMVCDETHKTYYFLDLQSNHGGGDHVSIRAASDGAGLRIPYDILVTEIIESEESSERRLSQSVRETRGHVAIAFDGAPDWAMNTFFEFWIFKKIQKILNRLWNMDQIWWNLRGYKDNAWAQLWIKKLGIKETSR